MVRDRARQVIVLTGGDPVDASIATELPADAIVIAADSGLHSAEVLGLDVDLVVGDFDSVDAEILAEAERLGAQVERHPEAKDRTDLALALDVACRYAPADVTVVGGAGGRLDHLLANVLLLASDSYRDLTIRAVSSTATYHVVRDEVTLTGARGAHVTLLPIHGPVHGVATDGLLYPLHGETLAAGSTRGVSNELLGSEARVRVSAGVLIAIQPGTVGTHVDQFTTDQHPHDDERNSR